MELGSTLEWRSSMSISIDMEQRQTCIRGHTLYANWQDDDTSWRNRNVNDCNSLT